MSFDLYVGNRSPSLADTIRIDGSAFNLTGSTVKLQMRAEASETLKVDSAAVIVDEVAGAVRYDWAAVDVDTPGEYVAWWRVTLPGGRTQDTGEFPVNILEHAVLGGDPVDWVTLVDVKDALEIDGDDRDEAIAIAITAASRALNRRIRRELTPRSDAATRTIAFSTEPTVDSYGGLIVSLAPYDLRAASAVTLNPEETSPSVLVANTDYALWPFGASPLTGTITKLRLARGYGVGSTFSGRFGVSQLRIVGDWGAWNTADVPADIKRACVVTVGSWIDKAIAEYSDRFGGEEPRVMQRPTFDGFAVPRAALNLLANAGLVPLAVIR